jgi:hypothetical protein
MKKRTAIAAIVAFAIFAAFDLVRDFVINDPLGYFSQQPKRLFYVAGMAITGGLVMQGFCKLPRRGQRYLRIFGLLTAASTTTAGLGYFASKFLTLASIISKNGGSIWRPLSMILPAFLMFCAIAVFCWVAFWRVWRVRVS